MQFGINAFVTDEGLRPGPLGKAVEERGFDALFLAEHSHIPVSRRTPYPGGGDLPNQYYRALDVFVSLTAAAMATTTLRLGTGVALVTQRDPISTAKEVASLDLVSDGRVIFGVGVGWNREEMENHGTDPATRGRLANERLEAMRQIWTNEQAEYHGEFVDFDPIYSWPKPVQRPHPPIYVGGGTAAFPRIAQLDAGWFPNTSSPEQLAPQITQLRETVGAHVPVTVGHIAPVRPELIEGYRELGVERVVFHVPASPEQSTFERLDLLAETVAQATPA
ncbi:LLM class F420-dependent oxidoreductase [Pseudonocardia sp. CA-142604]|uniref:LLM class F420-dependent oxidoreductase n=1 Tax=Pseudonocardia sp. CA-142604 TaxID=3240024 RepID=UPI003D8F0F9C